MKKKKTKCELSGKIGQRVREARIRKNLSQEQLGFEVKKPQSYIGKLERGEVMPRADSLLLVANALEVPVGSLYGDTITNDEFVQTVRKILSMVGGGEGKV